MAHILFAGSSPETTRTAVNSLAGKGHSVVVLEDGVKAWEYLQNRQPDVLFINDLMSGYDGYELVVLLHKHFPNAPTKIIFSMGLPADGEPICDWSGHFADSYMMRPFNPWQVVFAVEQYLYCEVIVKVPASDVHRLPFY